MLTPLFRNPNFRRLWLANTFASLGDQFSVVAFPWLVLPLTGDAVAMSVVLAAENVPRALFMLFGGALSDRVSPKRVLTVTSFMRLLLVATLAAVILSGEVALWMIYLTAFLTGTADAFYYPAANAAAPQVISGEQLHQGNTYLQGSIQVSAVVGPALAGLLIGVSGEGGAVQGVAFALLVNALTFFVAGTALFSLKLPPTTRVRVETTGEAIKEGLVFVWRDASLRAVFFLIMVLALFTTAPLQVGLPVLAAERLPQGASALGLLLSAAGVGSILGTVGAGVLAKPSSRSFGSLLMGLIALAGLSVAALGALEGVGLLLAALFLAGLFDGFVDIHLTTWLQLRTPIRLLGRVMSLLAFASVGLAPLSAPLMGAVIAWNLDLAFVIAGSVITACAAFASLLPAVRSMGLTPKEVSA